MTRYFSPKSICNRDTTIGPPKVIYKNVHGITVCKSPKLKTSQFLPKVKYKLWNNHKM